MEDSVVVDFRNQLLNEEGKKTTTDDGKVEVVDHEGTIQDEWLAVLHQLSAAEYNYVVCSQCCDSFCECRNPCCSVYESEVLRRIAKDARIALGEDWPDFNTKWAFDRGDWEVLEVERHRDKVLLCKWGVWCS